MARLKEDRVREQRIDDEIVVGAYGAEECTLGWSYHAENEMKFPFRARLLCRGRSHRTALQACLSELRVRVHWQGRTMVVPLSQLKALDANKKTTEVMEDWHYWTKRGYQF